MSAAAGAGPPPKKKGSARRVARRIHEGLGPSQLQAFAKICGGHSIFLTGSAGTGKSELLRRCTDHWEASDITFAITASTGIAAVNVGGRTLHSFLWLRPDDDDDEVKATDILARIKKSTWGHRKLSATLSGLQVLVIDEVSMMSYKLLEKASELLKLIRWSAEPFGGLQVILVGDFFQLPPVSTSKFLFETAFFYECVSERVELKEVFRQSDPLFVDLLGRMRLGALTDEDHKVLQSRVGADVSHFGVTPTELWSTNRDVDSINNGALAAIKTPPVVFKSHSGHKYAKDTETGAKALEKFLKDIHMPESVTLKAPDTDTWPEMDVALAHGTQVMLTYNIDASKGLVNGSRGVVVGFAKVPLAWKTESFFHDFDDADLGSQEDINKAYIRGLEMPKVRFVHDGHVQEIAVPYVLWSRKASAAGEKSKLLVYSWAIPLKLAWASTVHKSQGQSLDCVKVSLDASVFAEGQAYVAVSRARSLGGLTLKTYEPRVVRASERVVDFYKKDFGEMKPEGTQKSKTII